MTAFPTTPGNGWHLLQRKRDGEHRAVFHDRIVGWRLSDAIGRTNLASIGSLERRFTYLGRLVLEEGRAR